MLSNSPAWNEPLYKTILQYDRLQRLYRSVGLQEMYCTWCLYVGVSWSTHILWWIINAEPRRTHTLDRISQVSIDSKKKGLLEAGGDEGKTALELSNNKKQERSLILCLGLATHCWCRLCLNLFVPLRIELNVDGVSEWVSERRSGRRFPVRVQVPELPRLVF